MYKTIKNFQVRRSSIANKNHKFTVNLYNSTSSLLVNGTTTGVQVFVDDYFKQCLEYLDQNSDTINIINATVKESTANTKLSSLNQIAGRRNSSADSNNNCTNLQSVSLSASKPHDIDTVQTEPANDTSRLTSTTVSKNLINDISSVDFRPISTPTGDQIVSPPTLSKYIDTPTHANCPMCSKSSGIDTICCDTCQEWLHFDCVGLSKVQAEKIPNHVLYACPLCCSDLLIYKSPPKSTSRESCNNIIKSVAAHNPTSVACATLPIKEASNQVTSLVTHTSISGCVTKIQHTTQANISTNTVCTSVVTSSITSSSTTRRRNQLPKLAQENENLRSFVLELEQNVNDQEKTINLLNMAKPNQQYKFQQPDNQCNGRINNIHSAGHTNNVCNCFNSSGVASSLN